MAARVSALAPMLMESRRTSTHEILSRNSFAPFLGPSHSHKTKSRTVPLCCIKPCSPPMENEAMKIARKQFYEEITFRRKDSNISLAKASFLISAEDDAYISSNKEKDMIALQREGRSAVLPPTKPFLAEGLTLEGMGLTTWLDRLDTLANDVQGRLKSKANPVDILQAIQHLTKKPALTTDPKSFYLHHVLNLGAGTAIMLAILCIETCRRLGLELHGAPLGEDFVLWPSGNDIKVSTEGTIESQPVAEMIFEPFKGGKIWSQNADFADGFRDLAYAGSKPSSLMLKAVSNRAILTILLRNMKRMYWKRASRSQAVASEITAPLHPLVLAAASGRFIHGKEQSPGALLRPHDLRLAVSASEKLLLLQPHDWITRRDHGLLLYHSRRYGEALQELSICMAVAPVQEVEILEAFVEKLHLLRVESSWSFAPPALNNLK